MVVRAKRGQQHTQRHRLPGRADLLHGRGPGTITGTVNGTAFAADGRPTSHDLYGITCVEAAICYAVGDNGTIVARQ